MHFRLRDHLYWCACGDRPVFLDAVHDRYFALSPLASDAFLRLARGAEAVGDHERLEPLITRGLLIHGTPTDSISSPHRVQAPASDFSPGWHGRASSVDVVRAMISEVRTARLIRTRPLTDLLVRASGHHPPIGHSPVADDAVARIVSASATAAILMKKHDRCLVRALSLRAQCGRSGVRTTLVFGVRSNPFAAHCWVQMNDIVLVGDFEQARLYTPILVVR